jgi:hypothetical protein
LSKRNEALGIEYYGWQYSSAGTTAVWATENTREAIFDAMQRRETYATTGPRMRVRFFGGWEFDGTDAARRDLAALGYATGVPMGGDLLPAPEGATAPSFLVFALRDPTGANLDRVQIIKGWMDAEGNPKEKVYDVAWSDNRQPAWVWARTCRRPRDRTTRQRPDGVIQPTPAGQLRPPSVYGPVAANGRRRTSYGTGGVCARPFRSRSAGAEHLPRDAALFHRHAVGRPACRTWCFSTLSPSTGPGAASA